MKSELGVRVADSDRSVINTHAAFIWSVADPLRVFNFSSLPFGGSLGANPPDSPIVGIAPLPMSP